MRGVDAAALLRACVRAASAIPPARLAAGLALTALAYVALVGYDALALAYAGRRLSVARVAFASAVSYGVSQTLGFPLVTGGAVRWRLWRGWGLSAADAARATSFVGATFTLGVTTVAGAALLLEPPAALAPVAAATLAARLTGATMLAGVALYLAWSALRRGVPLRVGRRTLAVPSPALAVGQVGVAAADWLVAAAVLYALLPAGGAPRFAAFAGMFVLAQLAGVVSHVPGGLGVFDTLMVLTLQPYMSAERSLGVLLAYRGVYYLLPFAAAVVALAAHEARRHWPRLRSTARRIAVLASTAGSSFVARWVPSLLPSVLGAITFVAGAILLFSGATPSLRDRVDALDTLVPPALTELSHLAGSVAGAALLVLAWALRRRLDAAWGLTVALLVVGITASLLKGLDWEEALALGAVLAVVLPSRRAFYRKAALTAEPFEPGWLLAVLAVMAVTTGIGLLSYRHVGYTDDLWWQFSARADAPRFLRATAGAVGLLVVLALLRLLRHAEAAPALPDEGALDRAGRIARRADDTVAHLALLGDKALLFSDDGEGFIQYGVQGRSWIALGDPTGPPRTRTELAWRFLQEADRHGAWPVFYQVSADNLPLYIDVGLTLLKLGEEAHVPLAAFSLDGGARKGLRRVVKEVERSGATFEILPPERVPALMPELRRVSDAWLGGKATREKGFSLGRFDERYLARFPVAIVRDAAGTLVAFANVWASDPGGDLSVDLMRYTADAPRSVMEYLFVRTMLWGRDAGYRRFSLGMAPLAGFERGGPLAPRWSRIGALVYRHGEHFYNFRGLRLYKEKFDPEWTPKYLAAPGGLALPRVLANVTALISGGLAGVVKR